MNPPVTCGDSPPSSGALGISQSLTSTDDFAQQPQVINGGSNLLFELFGEEKGLPARTAMGTNSCPGNIAVEIEMLVEYE